MKRLFLVPVVMAATVPCVADNLVLSGDARLTGTVLSIHADGAVELSSSVAVEPILLKAGAVDKVVFSVPETAGSPPGSLIEFSNGDLLPVDIEGLTDGNLEVSNPDAGRLSIPRSVVKSMQLGVQKRAAIYSGPKDLTEWTSGNGSAKNWRFANNTLIAGGPAVAAKVFELPSKFVLKFNIRWQANPNLKIYFADPMGQEGTPVDRYYVQLTGSGLGVLREQAEGKREQTVISPSRGPEQFPTNQMDVEVRVDRKSGRIQLLINGEVEGSGVDPVVVAPVGNGVTIVSNSPPGLNQEIRAIEIKEYDNSRARHLLEERGDVRMDSLISRDEERWGGKLTAIRKESDGAVFSFKSDFQEEPLEIPQSEVSTIFFAAADKKPEEGKPPFSLRLRGDGVLGVSSCVFSADSIAVRHPLLGDLKFKRAGVAAVIRNGAGVEPEDESE